MRETPEITEIELAEFKVKAKAVMSGDFDGFFNSKFVDKDDYTFNLYSGYEIDKYLTDDYFNYSFSDVNNFNNTYLNISFWNGENIFTHMVLSNKGEVFILARDDKSNVLYSDKATHIDSRNLFSFASMILDADLKKATTDKGLEELSHYLKTVKDYEFSSSEDFDDFRIKLLREMEKIEFHTCDRNTVIDNLKSSMDNFNSIIIKEGESEYKNPFIFEIDGNIFYHDTTGTGFHLDHELRFIEAGEDFIFRGAVGIAQPGELKLIEMQLYGNYEMDVNEIEDNAEPEPVKKKQSKFKP